MDTISLWAIIATTVRIRVQILDMCRVIISWARYGLYGIRIITMRRCYPYGIGVTRCAGRGLGRV